MSIRVILSTGSLWVMDTALVFELAAEAGYDGIEIMCDDRYTTRNPDYLNRLSAQYNLPIPVAHTPFSPQAMGWGNAKTELGRVRHTLELANAIGAESIVVHLPFKIGRGSVMFSYQNSFFFPWKSATDDFYKWMASGGLKGLQKETPVQIAMENMPAKTFFGKPRDFAWWNSIEEWSNIHDHLTLDTTHWGTFGIDPIIPLQAAGERVKHIHLSNYDGREHRLPHEGELDLGAFLQELVRMDYQGTVSIELAPDALAFDNANALRQKLSDTLNFCREHLA